MHEIIYLKIYGYYIDKSMKEKPQQIYILIIFEIF